MTHKTKGEAGGVRAVPSPVFRSPAPMEYLTHGRDDEGIYFDVAVPGTAKARFRSRDEAQDYLAAARRVLKGEK